MHGAQLLGVALRHAAQLVSGPAMLDEFLWVRPGRALLEVGSVVAFCHELFAVVVRLYTTQYVKHN